ncbi:MAG: ribosome maturation factor RimM [Chromatiaceae bacterium]|jgi:16S rRNA processing protein RimM
MTRPPGDEVACGATVPGDEQRMVVLGRIVGLYGVRGWVKVFSETEPRQNILGYSPWYLGQLREPLEVVEGKFHGKGLVARLARCEDRDHAAALVGLEIAVRRDQLPPASAEEFYWADLEGLTVETLNGESLGRVDHIFSTAANDVLVLKGTRERLLPFIWDSVVKEVDFERGSIRVDWDPGF